MPGKMGSDGTPHKRLGVGAKSGTGTEPFTVVRLGSKGTLEIIETIIVTEIDHLLEPRILLCALEMIGK